MARPASPHPDERGTLMNAAPARPREVPEFRSEVYKPRAANYCVCLFVINEGERVRRQLAKMTALAQTFDVVIADGGSCDDSLTPDFLQAQGVRALLTKTGPGKLSAQMRMAFAWALDEGYEGVIVMDGNDKDDPAAIPAFGAALAAGWDHLQGSRFIPGGRHENTPLSRLLAVKFIHAPLISLAAGFPYTDTTNGFRAYSRKLLEDSRVQPLRAVFSSYELHYYLAIRAARLRFRVKELPVTRIYPRGEKTPTKISPLRGNMRVLGILWRAFRHRYDPPLPGATP